MNFSNPDSLPPLLREQVTYRDLSQGERLFRREDAARYIYILATGRIWLVQPTIENKTATLQFAKPGDIVGENALFEDVYVCNAIANVASRVIVYNRSCFTQIIENYPDLVEDLLRKLTQKISYYQTNIELREIRAAHQRVLQYLRYVAEPQLQTIHLDYPLQDIARQLGFTPATLSRALSKLEEDGFITRESNLIILRNEVA